MKVSLIHAADSMTRASSESPRHRFIMLHQDVLGGGTGRSLKERAAY